MYNTTQNIRDFITGHERGTIFFHSDFTGFGSFETTRKAVLRLCDAGLIRRYGRGIYQYPKIDEKFGLGEIPASNIDIARSYAEHYGYTLYVTETAAMNLLGLDTQTQTNTAYLTDGPSRIIYTGIGDGIQFIHTSDKNLSEYLSVKMMFLNIAMGYMKKYGIDERLKSKIADILSDIDDKDIEHDVKLMDIWKRNLIYTLQHKPS